MNISKTVQTQAIEQGLFAVHKDPHFTSYIHVSYMRAAFTVMNIRPNNILYQTLFVNCVSQTNVPQKLCKEARSLWNDGTHNQWSLNQWQGSAFSLPHAMQHCILSGTVFWLVLQTGSKFLLPVIRMSYFHLSIPLLIVFIKLILC